MRFLLCFEENQNGKQSLLPLSDVKGMVQTDTSLPSSSVGHRANQEGGDLGT